MILLIVGFAAVVLVCITAAVFYWLTNDTGQHAGPPAPARQHPPAKYQPVSFEPYDWGDDFEPYPDRRRPVYTVTLGVLEALNRRADELAAEAAAVRAQPAAEYIDQLDRVTRYEHSDQTDSFAAVAATWDDESDEGDDAPLDDPFTPPAEWYRELDDSPLPVGGAR